MVDVPDAMTEIIVSLGNQRRRNARFPLLRKPEVRKSLAKEFWCALHTACSVDVRGEWSGAESVLQKGWGQS